MSFLTALFSPLTQFWRKEFKNTDNRTRNLKTIRHFITVGLFTYIVASYQQETPSRTTSTFIKYFPELKFRWMGSVMEAVIPFLSAEQRFNEQSVAMVDSGVASANAAALPGAASSSASLPGAMASLPGAMAGTGASQ